MMGVVTPKTCKVNKYLHTVASGWIFINIVTIKYHKEEKPAECPVEPDYNNISLCNTFYIASDILWHKLIPHC